MVESKIEWIRVKDELPPQDVRVLGAIYGYDFIVDEESRTLGHVELVFVDEGGMWCCNDFGCPCNPRPTLWAYLPEAPNKNEI